MNWLDLAVLALCGVAIVTGWQRGFVVRVFSWAGLVGGVAIASCTFAKVAPHESADGSAKRFALVLLVLVAGAGLGQYLGFVLGRATRRRVVGDTAGSLDRVLGGLVGVVGVAFLVWTLLPTWADVPGWPSAAARSSRIAAWIDRNLGDPPLELGGLSSAMGLAGLPKVFSGIERSPEVNPPPAASPLDPAVVAAVEPSVVKVTGPACGMLQSGSGVVVSPGVVVTNAHVVAGQTSTSVVTVGGRTVTGRVIAFDPGLDLALVAAPALRAAPLPLSDAAVGDVGDAMGYPGGGALTVTPYRVSDRISANGRDIYDAQPVRRTIFVLGAALERGDSGGPLISPRGAVVGLAFAIAPDRAGVSYAIVGSDVAAFAGAARSGAAVATGPCTR